MAQARRLVINPSNTDQRYVLFSNGYLQESGGALPIKQSPGAVNNWPSQDAPTFYSWGNPDIAVAVQIIDWTIPSGYTLTAYGHVWPWGGAALVAGGPGAPLTGGPEYFIGINGGFPSPAFGFVIDFMMDPANTGKGYLLKYDGDVFGIGTAVPAVAHGPWLAGQTAARSLEMDWTSKRYWIADNLGRVLGVNGGNHPAVLGADGFTVTYPAYIWGRGGALAHSGLALYDLSATPKGFSLDTYGRAYSVGGALVPRGYQFTQASKVWVDIGIIDSGLSVNPLRLATLRENGTIFEWVVSTAPTTDVIAPSGTVTNATRPYVQWAYTDTENNPQTSADVRIIASTVYNVSGVNEVQRLTPSGTISGGTFRISFNGQQTSDLAFNAAAATVQTALEALPNIGVGNIAVAGGPINSAFVSLTFQNALSSWNWPQVTVISLLTGTTPLITPSTTTAGVGIDPAVAANVYAGTVTGTDTRIQPNVDLANATYRAYARATDSSGLTGGWDFLQFIQSVTVPATPTVTPTVVGGVTGVSLALHVNPAGLPAGSLFALQYHDPDWDGSTWSWVQGGFGAVPNGSGDATVIDYEARHSIQRSYRAFVYVYDATNDAWIQGLNSTTATATNTGAWRIVNPLLPAHNVIADVTEELVAPERPIVAATWYPASRKNAVVVTDGPPKSATFTIRVAAVSNAARLALDALMNDDDVLELLDPLGRAWFFRPIDRYGIQTNHTASTSTDELHVVTITAQEVDRPMAGPTVGPFAFTG